MITKGFVRDRSCVVDSVEAVTVLVDDESDSLFPLKAVTQFMLHMADGKKIERTGPKLDRDGVRKIFEAVPCDIMRLNALELWGPV